jgi:Tol biopolymer transport system component
MPPSSSRLLAPVLVLLFLVAGGCADAPEPGSSAASDSIATTAPGTDVVVAPLRRAGDSLRMGRPTPVTTRPGYDNQPAFLPDGSGLVWTAIHDGQADVYRQTVEGNGPPVQVTDTPESEFSPTPRSDGGMTVVRVEQDGRQRLWRYRADGTPDAPVLPDADSVGYHAWLDSTRVALFVLGTPPTLRVTNVNTGADTVVARRIGRSLQPVPGRAAVSFVQVAPDSTTAIHVLEGASLATRRLTATPTDDPTGDHAWTPDGRLLTATDDSLVAWRQGRDDWRPVAPLDTLVVSRLAVSPSGDRLALVVAE